MNDNSSKVIEVDINEVLPNRFQPRIQFDENEILELSDSIKEHGVIQPIVVRTIGDKYEIIAGERRYKASVLAGKETVPVIVKNLNDRDSAEIALIENVQRKNLTPIEEALSYKKILDMGYITQENLAIKLGKSQSSVANKIRLLNLSDEVQEALLENKISERHARSLLRLESSELQNKILKKIISERLTVRRTDEEIDNLKKENEFGYIENNDSQKIMEKGELKMNNNGMYGMSNTQKDQQTNNNFSMFEPNNQVSNQSQNFDIFTNVSDQQMAPIGGMDFDTNMSSMNNTQPPMQSIQEPRIAPIGEMNFDTNMSSMNNTQPTVQSIQEPQMAPIGGMNFGGNAMSASQSQSQNSISQNSQSNLNQSVPETAPIIDNSNLSTQLIDVENKNQMNQQSDNLFSFGNSSEAMQIPSTSQTSEFKMPEPIIITDYDKQYDPIMPQQTLESTRRKADFREVINAIRACSSKIEQYGYKIDVEEYDLADLYQVIFKIEK